MQRRIELQAPDQRICPDCHGMNWMYVPDSRVKYLECRLIKCERQHVAVLWIEDCGDPVELGPVISRA